MALESLTGGGKEGNGLIVELAADETLRVEGDVMGVHRDLILRGIADELLSEV